jgi:hypothetical protein
LGQIFPEERDGVLPSGHGFFEESVVGVVHFFAFWQPIMSDSHRLKAISDVRDLHR